MGKALGFYFLTIGICDLMGTLGVSMEWTDGLYALSSLVWFWLAYELYRERRIGRLVATVICLALTLASVVFWLACNRNSLLLVAAIVVAVPLIGLLHPRGRATINKR